MKTGSILDEICAKSRAELETVKKDVSFDELLSKLDSAGKRPPFKAALKKQGEISVIAELKKASPSRGLIRGDFDCANLALGLQNSGAAALSILTEKNYFLGDLEYLRKVSEVVGIPLLRKDFIFDKYQICQARLLGASAVLLIARMLSEKEFSDLFAFAKSIGLDVLAEAHNSDEIKMLAGCGADIIGVNCRNLANFSTDFHTAELLVPEIPDGIVKVCESAIDSAETLSRAKNAGADAALIGSALMESPDPSLKLKEILTGAK